MSSDSVNEEPKRIEESQRQEQRSIRDVIVDQVRRFLPSGCHDHAQEGNSSCEGNSTNTIPKPQIPRCSSQENEPNVTVLHVRASVQRADSSFQRPSDFSEQDSETEITISPPPGPPKVIYGPPPLAGAPPSYSAVMRLGPYDYPLSCNGRRRPIPLQPSPPFIAPAPPPSYAEAEGFYVEGEIASVEQMGFGPQPTAVVCPNCEAFIMTTIQRRSSNLTHFAAFILCLCGCWPCCLIPYCVDTCKIIHHQCPSCHQVLGVYRPW